MKNKPFTDPLECFQESVMGWAKDKIAASNVMPDNKPLPDGIKDITPAAPEPPAPVDEGRKNLLKLQDLYNDLDGSNQYIFIRALVRHEELKVMEALKEIKGSN